MRRVALVAGSGGIGSAMLTALCERSDIESVHSTYFRSPAAGSLGSIGQFGSPVSVNWSQVDITDDDSVAKWIGGIGRFDWLINCAGFLHDGVSGPEKTITQFDTEYFARSMRINCLPNLLLGKYAAPILKRSDKGIFAALSAKVGSIEDNRLGGWYSYRASKAASNMVIKNLAIEWQRSAPKVRVLALHPGTTDTALSKPFQAGVAPGKLFSPSDVAGMLLNQLDQAHQSHSGRFIAYDGEELPW